MRFGDSVEALNQSCRLHARPDHLLFDYTRAMVAAFLLWQPEPRRVLLIGVGGGSVPMAVRKLRPAARIDAVDIDPVVIEAAQRWFDLRPDALLSVHAVDGLAFVARARIAGERYDAILLDAFDAEGIPAPLFSSGFLADLRALLTNDGIFLANTFAGAPSADRETAAALTAFARFHDVRRDALGGNRLIVAAARPERLPDASNLWQGVASQAEALVGVGIDARWVEALQVIERVAVPPSAR
jgi:spermidine synthase